MAYGMSDIVTLMSLMDGGNLSERQRRIERQKLDALLGFCETPKCRRQVLLGYFGEQDHPPCGNCDNCLRPQKVWDGLIAAQKAISAVVRTGQRFGAAYLIDVLLGKATDRITGFGHDQIKTFGVGAELAKNEWHAVFRQLVALGHLAVDVEGHGGLYARDSASAVLRGAVPVTFRADVDESKRREKRARSGGSDSIVAPADEELWQALRALRLSLAREQGVPPYVIFHDATLIDMVRLRPRSLDALSEIPGVGASKLKRYGATFVAEVIAQGGLALRDAG
jgi:ATP-dependent DNA helicase RecQ